MKHKSIRSECSVYISYPVLLSIIFKPPSLAPFLIRNVRATTQLVTLCLPVPSLSLTLFPFEALDHHRHSQSTINIKGVPRHYTRGNCACCFAFYLPIYSFADKEHPQFFLMLCAGKPENF